MSMRRLFISLLFGAGLFTGLLHAQEVCTPDSVKVIDNYEHLCRYGNIYIGGQPSKEQIEWLRSEGVTQVVNLRTPKEIREFSRKNYDAGEYIESLGIQYTEVPVGGGKDRKHPDKLAEISTVLNKGEKALLYCKSGARARYVHMAYLVREKDCPFDTAKQIYLKMGYYFPMHLLFRNEIRMYVEEDS